MQVGQTRVQTTARYARLANDPLRAAVSRIANGTADFRESHLDKRSGLAPYPYTCVRHFMTGDEFVRYVRRLGRERGVAVRFESRKGKGSHGRLHYGDRFTTIKDRRQEIGHGLFAAMIRQLGLSREDIRGDGGKAG